METAKDTNRKKIFKKLPWLALLPLGFILPAIAHTHPWAVERIYAQGIYPYISKIWGGITNIFPFSAAEFFVAFFILAVISAVIAKVVRLIQKKITPLGFLSFFLSLAILAGVMLNLFYFMWGFNYSRPTLYQLMELDVKKRSTEELQELCFELCERANELRTQVAEDENGVFVLEEGYRPYFDRIPEAYETLGKKHSLFDKKAYPAKGVIASEGMSYAGIAGIFMPYTGEANVNVHQPPLLLLSSAAHETAHLLGFAKENEANFISYLACSSSDDPAIAYSGTMLALINCGNKLYKSDPEKYTPLFQRYSSAVVRDIKAYNAYWDNYEGEVEEAFTSINDNYLKFNQQEEGVKSYGMMVDLLLAYREKYQ